MTVTNITSKHLDKIRQTLPLCLTETDFDFAPKYVGKVRDTYDLGDKLVLITTDRQSGFDRRLASVPYKGQALNMTSAWWFEQTKHIMPNHVIAFPDPNVMVAKKCAVFPIEFVVRGYISGTTNTSLWTQYQNGVRDYCGVSFPDGLSKNQRLERPVITPTTKDFIHDKPISPEAIVKEGWMSQKDWDACADYALKLFEFGSQKAAEHGLILVDTKYEMGRDSDGSIILIDEIHTQDSSRYWLAENYEERFAQGLEPDNIDKEFLRLWFKQHCDPYKDEVLPTPPDDLIVTLSSRYIQLYEMITGQTFDYTTVDEPLHERILRNLTNWLPN